MMILSKELYQKSIKFLKNTIEFLVTNDRHFNKLKKLPFPKVNVLNEDEFKVIFDENLAS